jgi:outer membrane protein OmpA-like peptidoglycan-associated protein
MRRSLSLIVALVALAAPMLAGTACTPPPEPVTAPPPPPPPPPDKDGDGILDADDKCPNDKEDGLPPDTKDGCPTTDKDGDGIADADDKCPDEKEDNLPPDPKDGCKTTDRDGDGIADKDDKCPDEKETVNGYQDEDGCPDTLPRVMVTKTEVRINEKIQFATGKSTIDHKSDDLIKDIATVINDNPQIEFIEIAGHADKRGDPKGNAKLTKARAEAVTKELIRLGVDKNRAHPQGYGSYCPVDPGDSEESLEKNRRVEFKILRIAGVETGVPTGCEAAHKAGIKPTAISKNAPTKDALEKARQKAAADAAAKAAKAAKAPPAKAPPAKKK